MRSYYLLLFWLFLPATFGCVGSSLPSSLPTTTRTPPSTDIDTRSQEEINRELLEGKKEKEPQPNKTTDNTTKTPSNNTGEVRVREPQNNPTPTNNPNPNRNENNITQGNSNLNMLVLPYHQEDICQAFDELSQKQREGIDVVSQGFRDMGFQTGSFTSIMRKMKSSGGCDTHNPTRMLNTALRTAQCAYYAVIETDLDHVQTGSYLALNLTVYDSNTHNVITQQTSDSDRKFTDDTRELIKEAFEKMKPALARELNLGGKPNNTTKVTPNKQGKISVNLISDVDKDLPRAKYQNPDAIAVVIGNANYEKTKSVDYALNDAYAMKQYLITSFGFKEANIFYLEDARKSDFELMFGVKGNAKGKLFNNVKAGKSDVVIFYAGHGATGLNDKNAYFVPVDCDAQYLEIGGYPTDVFYQNLAQIPAKSFTVWLDACFSGTELVQNVSPIVVKGKGVAGLREGVLMASSTDDQYSTWYPEQGHGLFTYFLLKGIQQARADKNGDNRLTFNELYQYMSDKTEGVPYWARKLNNIEQVPLIKGNTIEKVLIEY